jgi:arylsulfatase A-like enzyme
LSGSSAAAPARSALLSGLRCGLAAGLLLGALEACERMVALRAFLRGGLERAWLAGILLFFPMLVGALLGLAGGAGVALAAMARRVAPLPAFAWRAVWGALAGFAAAGWFVFALTLTIRFDGLIARWPLLLGAGCAAGALAGLAWGPLMGPFASRWTAVERSWRGALRAALAIVLAAVMILIYLMNTYFAPQSSYGIHVLLLTALAACAALAVALMPRAVRGPVEASGLGLAVLLAVPADFAMRNRPRLECMVKIRTSTGARCVDLLSSLMDWDRDGFAPPFLVGGEDTAPFDPSRPPPILPREPAAASVPDTARRDLLGDAIAPPNLVLLTLDACRADVVAPARPAESPLGALRPPTPHLDSLAAQSARFDAAHTPSAGTEDTFESLFSGELPPGNLAGVDPGRYLARRLERRGYAVRAWVDDPHFARATWGFVGLGAFSPPNAPRMMAEAADFLGSRPPDHPGFVWIHVMDLHSEVLNPLSLAAYLRSRKLAAYARGLARVDSLAGMLLGALREKGVADRTLIALSADHGEEFGEHGHFHHNLALYEPAIRVPLWISGPRVRARALGVTAALEDLYPTLLEVAGVDPGATPARSLWPLLDGAAPAPALHYAFLPQRGLSRRYAKWARPEHGQAALVDPATGHKVILRIRGETWEAYDLRRDPLERDNLAGDGLAWADSMLAALRAEVARSGRNR